MKTLNILLLEDEQRAGEKLMDAINKVTTVAKIEWKRSVSDALQYLMNNPQVDLIFSDIELLDGPVFKVYESVQPSCPIIFCTAYNTYYVDAFKTNGIAYLLKPYSEVEFTEAWNKFQLLFDKKGAALPSTLLSQLQHLFESDRKKYKTTFSVKKHEGVFLLRIENVSYFQAQGDFVLAIDASNNKHVLNSSLTHIESVIDPNQFFRINRSEILNLNKILKYNGYTKNRIAITLSEPKAVLYTTNSRSSQFRNWVERN